MTRFAAPLALLLAACAWVAPAADGKLFDYQQITLDNGLRVITLEDFSCPIVAVRLWYHVGSKDEDPQRQGFAHMFEHMMFRGTDRLGPTDHFDLIRRTGGDTNAGTSFDTTVYEETLPASQLEMALWLEAERMAFLKIDQDNFNTERKVVEEERRMGLNRPYGSILEKALAEIFKEHPYRWSPIGSIPHLRAASVQELRDFWTKYYVPVNATLVIVGAVEHGKAQQLARDYFGWIPRYPEPNRVTIREPEQTAPRSVSLKDDNAPAPATAVLFRTVPVAHDDYLALQLLGTILGGGESSRLYRDLVADSQVAVVALAAAFSIEDDGLFVAGAATVPFGNVKKAHEAIEKQLERLRTEPVSDAELTKARNQVLRGLVTEMLTVESKAEALGSAAVLEGDLGRVNGRLERIRALTPESLLHVAQTYLAPQRAISIQVEQNLLGSLFGKKKEEDAPITATPETQAPAPGRPGVARPDWFPQAAPMARPGDVDPTPRFASAALPNGLKLLVVENHEVPFVSFTLGLLNGSWTEEKPGAASMALSMLTKGTAKYSDAQLAEELEMYAISLGGSADLDGATVSGSCLPEHLDRTADLLAEVVQHATFPAGEFDKLRKQVRTGLVIEENTPTAIAERELRRRLYGAHPYARTASGTVSDLDALTVEDAAAWWRRFARPDQAVLIFAGDVDLKRATELATRALGEWKAEGPAPQVALPPISAPAATCIYLVDRPGSVQSEIRVGQLGPTRAAPEHFLSRVVGDYFGGAFSSRLNETIRVKKGLTYGAGGGFRASRFSGQFRIGTFSKTDSTVEAVRAIFEEIARLQTEPPSDDELSRTVSYMVGSFARERETPQSVAGDLWLLFREQLPPDFYGRMLREVAAAKPEDCMRLIHSAIDPEKLVVVVVGDAKKIQAGLEAIAPVTVVKPAPSTGGDSSASAGSTE